VVKNVVVGISCLWALSANMPSSEAGRGIAFLLVWM